MRLAAKRSQPKRAAGQSNRQRFELARASLDRYPAKQRSILEATRSALASPELKKHVYEKLRSGLAYRFRGAEKEVESIPGFALPELYRETSGYRIPRRRTARQCPPRDGGTGCEISRHRSDRWASFQASSARWRCGGNLVRLCFLFLGISTRCRGRGVTTDCSTIVRNGRPGTITSLKRRNTLSPTPISPAWRGQSVTA